MLGGRGIGEDPAAGRIEFQARMDERRREVKWVDAFRGVRV